MRFRPIIPRLRDVDWMRTSDTKYTTTNRYVDKMHGRALKFDDPGTRSEAKEKECLKKG
jgi:hypothetical protein